MVTVTSPYEYRVQYINLIHYNMKAKRISQKAENRKLIRLAILDAGIPLKNVIYYNHSNNWNDCEAKVTKNQFDEFIKTVDKTKLPENITFKLK